MYIDEVELEKWKNKNSNVAGYAHFDSKFGLKSAWDYITNPDKVKSHGFFPFITYDQVFYKVSKKDGKVVVKEKVRPICYASHIDRCIYQYYSYLLNETYNVYAEKKEISKSVVAYRTNLHKNNIHFAKQAFDFIKQEDCSIIVGDFKGFFDNLDHKHLKEMLCKTLEVETLSDDWYAVYKNITKYSTWELIDILKLKGLITSKDIMDKNIAHENALKGNTYKARKIMKRFDKKIEILNGYNIKPYNENSKILALTKEQFKKYKKSYLKRNSNNYGIPQGSPISAVLSNIYMADFDEKLKDFVNEFKGLYLRYSDDFIIVVPKSSGTKLNNVVDFLNDLVEETTGLYLEDKKTQIYLYENQNILNIKDSKNQYKSYVDYLGFIFDGKEVTLRPKTVSKYYYRMYKKVNYIVKCDGFTKNGNRITCSELYKNYTQKGRNGTYIKGQSKKVIGKNSKNKYKTGNFLSYVYKADEIFNKENKEKIKTENPQTPQEPITRSTKRHMLKIRRKLDKINLE